MYYHSEGQATQPLRGITLLLVNVILSLATFMYVLDYSIVNVAIPYISGDLAISVDDGTYVITSFAVGNAIALPMSGFLTKRFGRVFLFALSVALFTLLSWVCAAAPTYLLLVIARFVQGVVAGPIIPLSQSILTSCNPKEKLLSATAFWATIVVVAPILGPVIGGWITYNYSWRWIFYINVPIGILCTLLIYPLLREKESKKNQVPIDYIGIALLAVASCSLQVFLDKGQDWDWFKSDLIKFLAITSFIAYFYLIFYELYRKKDPLLDLELFRLRSFRLSLLLIFCAYSMYFGAMVLIPLWLQTFMGYDAVWAGISIAPFGIFPFLLSTLVPKIIQKIGKLIPVMICMVFYSLSSVYFMTFDTNVDLVHIWYSRLIMGFGFTFLVTPLLTLSIQDVEEAKMPDATGIFHYVRSLSGGVGTAVFTALWQRRMRVHTNHIADVTNSFNPQVEQFFQTMQPITHSVQKSKEILFSMVEKQAAMLALNDCFFVIAWVSAALFVVVLIARIQSKVPIPLLEDIKKWMRSN